MNENVCEKILVLREKELLALEDKVGGKKIWRRKKVAFCHALSHLQSGELNCRFTVPRLFFTRHTANHNT